jgi:hypothetical protein
MNIEFDGEHYKLKNVGTYIGPMLFADKDSALRYLEALLLCGGNVPLAVEKVGLVLHSYKEVIVKESRFIEDCTAYRPIFKLKSRRKIRCS